MIQCLMFDVFWERNKNKNKIKRKVGKNRHHLAIMKGYSLKFQSQAVLIESIELGQKIAETAGRFGKMLRLS